MGETIQSQLHSSLPQQHWPHNNVLQITDLKLILKYLLQINLKRAGFQNILVVDIIRYQNVSVKV